MKATAHNVILGALGSWHLCFCPGVLRFAFQRPGPAGLPLARPLRDKLVPLLDKQCHAPIYSVHTREWYNVGKNAKLFVQQMMHPDMGHRLSAEESRTSFLKEPGKNRAESGDDRNFSSRDSADDRMPTWRPSKVSCHASTISQVYRPEAVCGYRRGFHFGQRRSCSY